MDVHRARAEFFPRHFVDMAWTLEVNTQYARIEHGAQYTAGRGFEGTAHVMNYDLS